MVVPIQPQREIPGFFNHPAMKPFPYVREIFCKALGIPNKHESDQLEALSMFGIQISVIGTVYSMIKGQFIASLCLGAASTAFNFSYMNVQQMKKLEEILEELSDNNKVLRTNIDDFQKAADRKIKKLSKSALQFKRENKKLHEEVGVLASLIKTSEVTMANILRLQDQEKECIEKYETIKNKLQTIAELFEKERGSLSQEIKNLALEVNRLSEIPV